LKLNTRSFSFDRHISFFFFFVKTERKNKASSHQNSNIKHRFTTTRQQSTALYLQKVSHPSCCFVCVRAPCRVPHFACWWASGALANVCLDDASELFRYPYGYEILKMVRQKVFWTIRPNLAGAMYCRSDISRHSWICTYYFSSSR
jgi:hypothetical protein